MIYLIQEYAWTTARTSIKGYYGCDNEAEVKEFCANKNNEIKGNYDEDRLCKTYFYKELSKFN